MMTEPLAPGQCYSWAGHHERCHYRLLELTGNVWKIEIVRSDGTTSVTVELATRLGNPFFYTRRKDLETPMNTKKRYYVTDGTDHVRGEFESPEAAAKHFEFEYGVDIKLEVYDLTDVKPILFRQVTKVERVEE